MKTKHLLLTTACLIIYASCYKVPVTGRRQMHLLPESMLMSMSFTSYKDVLNKSKVLPATDERVQLIQKVGNKMSAAVALYLKRSKQTERIKGFKWEYQVIEDKIINAWCMPGGKIVFYTGILPLTMDETGIAVVMGHEIAHAIARHGNERMSQGLALQLGGIALQVAVSEKSQETQELFNQSYGITSGLGMLAFSRKHESEADKMGLVFMAMAGYDPKKAVDFWQRMAKSGGPNVPALISTHPSDEKRIKDIKEFLPKALKYYKPV